MAARRALRRGEAPLPEGGEAERGPAQEEEGDGALGSPGTSTTTDVPMEEAPVDRLRLQAAPDTPMDEWSAEQSLPIVA